jgi:hypothetical protein
MIFNRTYRYNTPLSMEDIKQRLLGQHIQVHHMDFEITEKEKMLKIIPHAEEANGIKTLPITHVEMQGMGASGTKVIVSSKPRRIDVGGPYLIVIFCLFCILGASGFYIINPRESYWPSLAMIAVGVIIFIIFWLRMEAGYFDYTRKIRDFVKHNAK